MNGQHSLIPSHSLLRGKVSGFSLVELVIVVAVVAIATAMAVPVIVNANNTYQLRSATTALAATLQKSRIYCIQQNKAAAVQTNATVLHGTAPIGSTVFLDLGGVTANGTPDPSWPQVQFPTNITQTSSSAPTISSTTLGFSPQTLPAYFNGRGLPCAINAAGVCSNWSTTNNVPVGYVYYLKQVSNGTRWSAVSVTPGGQIKTWMYNGSTWTNR